jgi:hypothetical protein
MKNQLGQMAPAKTALRHWRSSWHPGGFGLRGMVLVAALALSGCATMRYVTVPCISHDQQLPAEPPKIHDQLTGKADEDLRTVAGSAVRLRAWGQGLRQVLEGCRER